MFDKDNLEQINIDEVQCGDYIYINCENTIVKVFYNHDGYNAIDKNGCLTDTDDTENLDEYLDDWCEAWFNKLEFYKERD